MKNKLTSICAWCSRVKEGSAWVTKDERHKDANLTHGCCPFCVKAYHPEIADKVLKNYHRIDTDN